jgi:hypothetical protein
MLESFLVIFALLAIWCIAKLADRCSELEQRLLALSKYVVAGDRTSLYLKQLAWDARATNESDVEAMERWRKTWNERDTDATRGEIHQSKQG